MKKTRKKTAKKNDLKLYFHSGTHDAIVQFQTESDYALREKIYSEDILPAFTKLVENLIFIHGANAHVTVEDFKNDCISFLYEKLNKFDANRGSKAFSYFNVVAKNWIIVKMRQTIKHTKKHINIDDKAIVPEIEVVDVVEPSFELYGSAGKKANQLEQIDMMFFELNDRIEQEHERICMEAITKLFQNIDEIDFFNKRAVFVYIREMTNLTTKQISTAMSSIKKHYREAMAECEFDIFQGVNVAKKSLDVDVANQQLDILKEKEKKVRQFDEILNSIEGFDDKKKYLWSEIYKNAITDRESASILYTDTVLQLKGNTANHTIMGPVVVKYIERMSRANDQLIKLAELITKEDNKPLDTNSIFDQISEDD